MRLRIRRSSDRIPKPPVCAAIYAGISSDQDGTALGVTRQLEDCRALAKKLGWTVADEYVDNDISAYTVKERPAYQRMLGDVAAGDRDAVIAYHLDRLTRRPIELEHFVEVATTANVTVRFVSGGDFDLVSGDGLMVMRMLAAVAAGESATWEPIITVEQRDKVMALMDRRASTRERTPRSYLLTGLLRCGKCDNRLFSWRRENSRRQSYRNRRSQARLAQHISGVPSTKADRQLNRLWFEP
ncbi:hypothetical protein BH10ACT2_BH10ACT2_24240 [soil metagenome]